MVGLGSVHKKGEGESTDIVINFLNLLINLPGPNIRDFNLRNNSSSQGEISPLNFMFI